MAHHCPHCGAELEYHDSYGRIRGGWMEVKNGEIYKCPNHEGFATREEALAYEPDATDWEEVTCHSATHHVSGSFYTDRADNLHEGYPC